MHYHPTNDFPINLEHVFKIIGFANKGNAMKTIKSNFVVDEDYKLGGIPGYEATARNVPEENTKQIFEKKSSKYIGVSYDSNRKCN